MSTRRNPRVIKSNDLSDLRSLPADTGGRHLAHPTEETDAPYGYYIYLPGGYEQSSDRYPLLVFLHGAGESDDKAGDADPLRLLLVHGPPYLVHNGRWNPPYPMVVASPQAPSECWQPEKVDGFIRYIVENYRVNRSRVYMTGLSMGGDGIFSYLAEMGDRSLVAAAVAVCGEGTVAQARKARVPIWLFHGEDDGVVPVQTAIEMKEGFINAPEVRLTVYPDIAHGTWSETYDLSGMGRESKEYDPYNTSIYDWMLTYSLSEDQHV